MHTKTWIAIAMYVLYIRNVGVTIIASVITSEMFWYPSQCAPASIQSRVLEVCHHTIASVSSTLRSHLDEVDKAEGRDINEENERKVIFLKLCQARSVCFVFSYVILSPLFMCFEHMLRIMNTYLDLWIPICHLLANCESYFVQDSTET